MRWWCSIGMVLMHSMRICPMSVASILSGSWNSWGCGANRCNWKDTWGMQGISYSMSGIWKWEMFGDGVERPAKMMLAGQLEEHLVSLTLTCPLKWWCKYLADWWSLLVKMYSAVLRLFGIYVAVLGRWCGEACNSKEWLSVCKYLGWCRVTESWFLQYRKLSGIQYFAIHNFHRAENYNFLIGWIQVKKDKGKTVKPARMVKLVSGCRLEQVESFQHVIWFVAVYRNVTVHDFHESKKATP